MIFENFQKIPNRSQRFFYPGDPQADRIPMCIRCVSDAFPSGIPIRFSWKFLDRSSYHNKKTEPWRDPVFYINQLKPK